MRQRKHGSRWVRLAGLAITVLGVSHLLATYPVFLADRSEPGSQDLTQLYMFVIAGLAVSGAGLLFMYCAYGLHRAERWAWMMASGVGVFMFLVGAGAVLTMPDNPFAYLSFLAAVAVSTPLHLYRSHFLLTDSRGLPRTGIAKLDSPA